MRELYAEYRAFAVPKGNPRFDNVEDELRILKNIRQSMKPLKDAKMTIKTFIGSDESAAWQVTTAYPISMQISASDIDEDEKRTLYRLIYSYIVVARSSGLTAKNLNRVFQSISQAFKDEGPSVLTMSRYFAERTGDSTRFPSDKEFHQGFSLGRPTRLLRRPGSKMYSGN